MRITHLRDRGWRAPNGEAARAGEAGETLLEVMFSVMLMAIAFSAILGGIYTSARVANMNRDRTRGSVALQAYSESLLQPIGTAGTVYRPCVTTLDSTSNNPNSSGQDSSFGHYTPNAPVGALPSGWRIKITRVVYLAKANSFPYPGGTSFADPNFPTLIGSGYNQFKATEDCSNGMDRTVSPQRDGGIQMLTLLVEKPDPGSPGDFIAVDSIVVAKRDQRCSAAAVNANYVDQGPC